MKLFDQLSMLKMSRNPCSLLSAHKCWVSSSVDTKMAAQKKGWIHDCCQQTVLTSSCVTRHVDLHVGKDLVEISHPAKKEIILTKSMMLIQIVEIDHHVGIPKQRSCWNTGWNETREMFINVCWWHRSWLKRVRVCFCVCIVCSRSCARVRIVH